MTQLPLWVKSIIGVMADFNDELDRIMDGIHECGNVADMLKDIQCITFSLIWRPESRLRAEA